MKRGFLSFLILSLAVAPAYAKRFASGPVELQVDPAKGAVVESKIPEGGDAADTTRYEVILKK